MKVNIKKTLIFFVDCDVEFGLFTFLSPCYVFHILNTFIQAHPELRAERFTTPPIN